MIHKFVLLAAILLLFSACSASEPPENDSEVGGTVVAVATKPAAEKPALETVVTRTESLAAPTATPPPPPSPVPTVTALEGVPMESTFFPASDERIRYIGRFDFDNPGGPAFDWSGTAIEFSFFGTGLALHLIDGRNIYNVLIDGQNQVLKTEMDQKIYPVAEGLEPGEHSFRLSKRTEAYVGAAVFEGVDVLGNLTESGPGNGRHIEFIGDSITAGYGNEGESPDCWFTPDTENADRSYAAITAGALDAEYSMVALSGLGVVRNLRGDTISEETAIDYIDRALGLNPFIVWPSDSNTPDVVVINLGTNDYSSVPFPTDEAFVTAYVDLLRGVRDRYPEAIIFSMAGPLMLEPAPWVIRSAVEQFRAANDDTRVHYMLIEDNLEQSAEDFGCAFHPNVNGHEKIAAQLTPVIAEQLGW